MKLTLIYSTATGQSREQTIDLNSSHFSIGDSSEHAIALPGDPDINVSCDIDGDGINISASAPIKIDKLAMTDGRWLIGKRLESDIHCLTLQSISDDNIVIDVSLFASSRFLQRVSPFKGDTDISLGKRKITYLLLFLVVFLGFASPLAYHFYIKSGGVADNWHGPTDEYWTSGDLVNAHQHRDIDGNCQVCHSDLWVQVQDKNCLTCHHDISAHAQYNPHQNIGEDAPRCASCHREHSGEKSIVNYNSAGCIGCHKEPELWSKNEHHVRTVSNFDAANHPPFKLAMLTQTEAGWQQQRVDFNDDVVENSHLKFSHQLHLNVDKINRDERPLECADCHQLKADNEHFVPVSMEANCIECHSLGIDIEASERQLPHGSPREVVKSLEEFMSFQYINPEFRKNRQQINVRSRAIPGKEMIRSSFDIDPCTELDSVYECVADEVEELASVQFERAGCITCHDVDRTDSESVYDRWQVKEVRLQNDWYAAHTFDHLAHLSGDYKTNSGACLSCHAATIADNAEVVLIPKQENCLNCHIQGNPKSVELNCLNCHMFHRPEQPAMSSDRVSWQ